MKTLIKYLTLLLVSGVIIPLYLYSGNFKIKPVIAINKTLSADKIIQNNDAPQFSFINDVASKLLPGLKYFQFSCNL